MKTASVFVSVLGGVALASVGASLTMSGCGGSKGNSNGDLAGADLTGSTNDMATIASGFSCTTGTLFAGAPVSAGVPGAEAATGSALVSDPPVHWESLVFSGSNLFTRNQGELWWVDTSTAAVQTKIAGNQAAGSTYNYSAAAPCSTVSFTEMFGLGVMPDGSLVASDLWGNAVLKIANPTNASTCAVTVLAGNGTATMNIDPSDSNTFPPVGNMNGAGTAATFNTLGPLTVDSAGVVYVYDTVADSAATASAPAGTGLIRKIETANGNAVTTLATLNGSTLTRLLNFTTIGTALYAVGDDGANTSYVVKVDTTSGALTTIKSGMNMDGWPPAQGPSSPDIAGITNDGTNLIVSGSGFVWYLTLSGTLTAIAGTTPPLNADFPTSGYDPTASHPALSLELVSDTDAEETKGLFDHIAYHSGAVYYRGYSQGDGFFVEKIACQ